MRFADGLSQSDFWPAETHRDPSGDEPQHELARVTLIIRHVIGKFDAVSSVSCHDPHFKGRGACRKAVPVHREPMSLGKVEEHSRIATFGNDSAGRGIGLEPVLFKISLPRHTMHSILSIQDVVRSTVRIENGWCGRQLLEAASRFLATRAKAGGSQNRPPNCLQFYRTALAYLMEVFLLILVQRNRPFVDSVYPQWITSRQNARKFGCPLYPKTDICSTNQMSAKRQLRTCLSGGETRATFYSFPIYSQAERGDDAGGTGLQG